MSSRRSSRRRRPPGHLTDFDFDVPNDGLASDLSDMSSDEQAMDIDNDTMDSEVSNNTDTGSISGSHGSEESDDDEPDQVRDAMRRPRLVLTRVNIPPANVSSSDDSDTDSDDSNQPGPAAAGPRRRQARNNPDIGTFSQLDDDALWANVNVRPFNGPQPGQCTTLPPNADPIHFFDLFVDQNFINNICFETNRYAMQCFEKRREKRRAERRAAQDDNNDDDDDDDDDNGDGFPGEDITPRELKAFLGFMICAHNNHISQFDDIWSTDAFHNKPALANVMSRNRFWWICTHLHFADNAAMPGRDSPNFDPMYKVKPVLEHFKITFQMWYKLHQMISADESICRFKGRHSAKQYDKSKPIKRGFKLWTLADGETGYVYDFEVYTGKKFGELVQHNQGLPAPTKTLGHRSILSIMPNQMHRKNHILYVDRFFTSAPLFIDLRDNCGIYAAGTSRKNAKGAPKELSTPALVRRMERGESHFMCNDKDYVATAWKDNSHIIFQSTAHCPTGDEVVGRRDKTGVRKEFPAPPVVVDYNKYMNGVDRADGRRYKYGIDRKSKRWPNRLFWHCFDWAVANAYVIYLEVKQPARRERSQLYFRKHLVASLIGNFSSRKRRGRPSINPPIVPAADMDHLSVNLSTYGHTRRRCVMCKRAGERRESSFGCHDCNDIPLCRPPRTCHHDYHH